MHESDALTDYKSDQTVIVDKKFLNYISVPKVKQKKEKFLKSIDWWPNCNSYYAYLEDTDALSRKEVLQNAYRSDSNISVGSNILAVDCYNERDAQNRYLSTPPLSFVILGKPNIGEEDLGKLLAEHWRAVYIDSQTVIEEEIASGSRAGQCIEFNLRCGRAISADVIMRLVEKRTKSKSARHRGFVLCGFPLIANELFEEDPVSSESAIFNVQEIFDEFVDAIVPEGTTTSAIQLLEEQDQQNEVAPAEIKVEEVEKTTAREVPLDVGSATFTICSPPEDPYKSLDEQIDQLFSFITNPFLIIYVVCDNKDVVKKRADYRYDLSANKMVDFQKEATDKVIYAKFSKNPSETSELPEGFIYITKYDTIGADYTNRHDLLQLPRHFPSNVISQLDKYRGEAMTTIEKYVLMHDPQYVIKLDGRTSPCRMFYATKLRLDVLPFQKPIFPERLNIPDEETIGGEGQAAPQVINFEGMTFSECFNLLSKKRLPSPMFKWSWSDWSTKCPVSMKNGFHIDGNPNYAVQFMNKIFFLADEDAFIKFYRNPRLYLLPPYPKFTDKIFVMAPPHVLKETVAKCLSYVLDLRVISLPQLENDFLKRKQDEYLESVRVEALRKRIEFLTSERLENYNSQELYRKEALADWKKHITKLLYYYSVKTSSLPSEIDVSHKLEEQSSVVVIMKEQFTEDVEEEASETVQVESSLLSAIVEETPSALAMEAAGDYYDPVICLMSATTLQEELQKNNIPCGCNVEELLADPDSILKYADDSLLLSTYWNSPSETEEAVTDYVNFVIKHTDLSSIELTLDDLIEIYFTAVKDVDESESTIGWIVCGMIPNVKLLENIENNLPDEVFILVDTSEDHNFLVDRYRLKNTVEFTNFKDFFLENELDDAALRCSVLSTTSYKERMTEEVMDSILNECVLMTDDADEDEELTEEEYFKYFPRRAQVDEYQEQLLVFDQDILKVKDFFATKNVSVNQIMLTNKSTRETLQQVLNIIFNKYRQPATVFTDEDRAEELKDFGEPALEQGEEDEEEVFDEEEQGDLKQVHDFFERNRRYGDTYHYCPVAFKEKFVLWRGKDRLGARFENKIYFLHSEDALTKFLNQPKKYLFKSGAPKALPPPRICVTGLPGSGKTALSKRLSRNLGLYYCNFIESVQEIDDTALGKYIHANEPLPEAVLDQVLLPYWFKEPMRTVGFVLDGFPRRTSDITYMINHLTIADMIINLEAMQPILQERLKNLMFLEWKEKTDYEKLHADWINKQRIDDWEVLSGPYRVQVLEELRQKRYEEERQKALEKIESQHSVVKKQVRIEATNDDVITVKSQVSYHSVADEQDQEVARKIVEKKYPPPVLLVSWPTDEEANVRIVEEIQQAYNNELQYFPLIKDVCYNEIVPWTTVDANLSMNQTFALVMKLVDPIKFRNESLFERCYDISTELAETLLNCGYCFLSKFGRMCPVQYFNKYDTFPLYLSLMEKFDVFPVIHRSYIYFLAGKKNHDKFVENPLKYVSEDFAFPLVAFRIAIIGAPKSGKTTLAERFKSDLGLKLVSIGKASRHVLELLPYTDLALKIEEVLRNGWQMTPEMEMRCVAGMCLEASGVALGCVFDGFPHNKDQVRYMAEMGILPHLVLDLTSDQFLIEEFRNNATPRNNIPNYSKTFVSYQYSIWCETQDAFRQWLEAEYQIVAKVPVQPCKWGVWHKAYDLAAAALFEMRFYHLHAGDESALRLSYMQVSPMEFVHRRSSYKEYCLGCLLHRNEFICTQLPPDRSGLVQYKYYYYWLCEEHVETFIRDPEKYLSPYNPVKLPEDLPRIVKNIDNPQNLHAEGVCMVCYVDRLPEREIHEGLLEFAVEYHDKIYLFCLCKCRDIFMRNPEKYCYAQINFKGEFNLSLTIKDLPILGYLEQFVSHQVVKAIANTVNERPFVCGLSIAASAAVNVAFYLKLHNPNTSKEVMKVYENAFALYQQRRQRFLCWLKERKDELNPYLYYMEPVHPLNLAEFYFTSAEQNVFNSNYAFMTSIIWDLLCFIDGSDDEQQFF